MNKYIPLNVINEWCTCKNDRTDKRTQSGKLLPYCKRFDMYCFLCIDQCKQESIDSENKAIDAMEKGICECENMFEPDYMD